MIQADAELITENDHDLVASGEVRAGHRMRLSIVYADPAELEDVPPELLGSEELDARLDRTCAWWRRWVAGIGLGSSDEPAARRSAIVLKGLSYAPTGAIAAAPSTSLPERLAECLAHQGRVETAREVFDRASSAGNDLGLFAEEYDSASTEQLLGNFPQGLSHIGAAVALAGQGATGSVDRPEPS